MSIKEKEAILIEEFSMFEDSMDRYEHLIAVGEELTDYPESLKDEAHLVKGCASKVWLMAEEKDGRIYFTADSNTQITKGIVSALIRILSGALVEEIINHDLAFIDKIELRSHLSSQRNNGLAAMIKTMKLFALAFKLKEDAAQN